VCTTEKCRVAFTFFRIITPVIAITTENCRVTYAVFRIASPVVSQMFAAEKCSVAFAVYWIVAPVIAFTTENCRVAFAVLWIVAPVESQVWTAETCRVAFAVSWIVTPVIAIYDTAFNITVAHTEFWVIMVVIPWAAFFGAIANAVVVLPIEFFIATLFFGIARCAICVFSPSLLWAAIEIWVAVASERVSEPSVIVGRTAVLSRIARAMKRIANVVISFATK
jgi:hypothetical protein